MRKTENISERILTVYNNVIIQNNRLKCNYNRNGNGKTDKNLRMR